MQPTPPGVRVRLLGELRLLVEGDERTPSALLPQRLLALLAVRAGRPVAVRALVEELWEDPPDTAHNVLQVYVSGLRRLVGAGAVERVHAGYRLAVAPAAVDLLELEARLAAADADAGPEQLPELAPAVAALPSVRRRYERVSALRLSRLERALERDLDAGRLDRVLSDVPLLLAEHPLRERLHELLLQAQHAAGRRDEALETFRAARRLLQDELGLEPGARLQALHQQVLTGQQAAPARAPSPPGLRSRPAPRARDSFHGREAELSRLRALLADDAVPLVTVTGPGGVGKTRLALQALQERHAAEPLLWVPLEQVRPGGAVAAVLRALGLAGAGPVGDEELLRGLQQPVLLVLDNAEHLPDVPVLVQRVLAETPARLLLTSRAPLRLRGERVLELAPLALTDPAAALALLRERVAAAAPAADPPEEPLRRLVELVDGLPLALEILAVHLAALPPEDLLHGLAGHLLRLPGNADLPERQRTLAATVAWSLDLLTPQDRADARLLAVLDPPVPVDLAAQVLARDATATAGLLARLAAVHVLRRPRGPASATLLAGSREALRAEVDHEQQDRVLDALVDWVLQRTQDNAAGWPFEPRTREGQAAWLEALPHLLRVLTDARVAARRPAEVLRTALRCSTFLAEQGEAATALAVHRLGLDASGLSPAERLLQRAAEVDVLERTSEQDGGVDAGDGDGLDRVAAQAARDGTGDLALALASWARAEALDLPGLAALVAAAERLPVSATARLVVLNNAAYGHLVAGDLVQARLLGERLLEGTLRAGHERLALEALVTLADTAALAQDRGACLRWSARAVVAAEGFPRALVAGARACAGHAEHLRGDSAGGLATQLAALRELWHTSAHSELCVGLARAAQAALSARGPRACALLALAAERVARAVPADGLLPRVLAQWRDALPHLDREAHEAAEDVLAACRRLPDVLDAVGG